MHRTVRKEAKEKRKNKAKKLPKTWRFLHRNKLSNRIDRKKRRVAKTARKGSSPAVRAGVLELKALALNFKDNVAREDGIQTLEALLREFKGKTPGTWKPCLRKYKNRVSGAYQRHREKIKNQFVRRTSRTREKTRVFHGDAKRTTKGLTKMHLCKSSSGKVVSVKAHEHGVEMYKRNLQPFHDAFKAAKEEQQLTGFVPVGGKTQEGLALIQRAREIHAQRKSSLGGP